MVTRMALASPLRWARALRDQGEGDSGDVLVVLLQVMELAQHSGTSGLRAFPCRALYQESVWQRKACGTFLPERADGGHTTDSYFWLLKKPFQFSFPWGGQKAKPEFTPNHRGCQNLWRLVPHGHVMKGPTPLGQVSSRTRVGQVQSVLPGQTVHQIFPRLCPFCETSFWQFLLWINGKCRVILPSLLSSLEGRAPTGKAFRIRSQPCLSFKEWREVGWPKSLPLCSKWNQFNWKWKCRFP